MKPFFLFLFICLAFTGLDAQAQMNDSASIHQLLIKEAATWRSGDVAAHASCWMIRPYSTILVTTSDDKIIVVPPAYVVAPPGGNMGNGGHAIITNLQITVHDGRATASHNEESVSAKGEHSYSYEVRQLEKHNGEWKLVSQYIKLYQKK